MRWGLHPIPQSVFDNEPITFISVGGCLSIFITASGAVYTVGVYGNAEGQKISGHEQIHGIHGMITTPKKLNVLWDQGVRAVSASAGRLHGIVLDQHGHLYGWGTNTYGQLGLPIRTDVSPNPNYDLPGNSYFPQRLIPAVEGGESIQFKQISCSWQHSLAVSVDGIAYSLGRYYNAQQACGYLGRESVDTCCFNRMNIDPSKKVRYAEAGMAMSLLLLECDDEEREKYLVTCGSARNDQLGGNGIVESFVKVQGHDCRVVPFAMTWEECCYSCLPPRPQEEDRGRGNQRGRTEVFTKKRVMREYEEEENEEEDDEEDDDEEEDDDGEVCITVDYADLQPQESAADSFLDLMDRIMQSPENKRAIETEHAGSDAKDEANLHLLICNHYGFGTLSSLTTSLAAEDTVQALGQKLVRLTFVSCSLFATPDDVQIFVATIAESYPRLASMTFDMTTVSNDLNEGAGEDNPQDNESLVTLCSALPERLSSLRTLYLEQLGNDAVLALASALTAGQNSSKSRSLSHSSVINGIKTLTITAGKFDDIGFETLGNMLGSNSALQVCKSVLQ
jgi:hypothetical protein